MPRIRAFDGYLVDPARAGQVVSPAYDAVSPEKRRQFAEANPQNYLNTMRLREDFPADAQPTVEKLLALNKARLDELLRNGSFNRFAQPCIFIYRLAVGGHTQTGVVCEVSVDEYHHGRLRKHENTRSDKEDLLAMYQQVVGVTSSPICLAYPHDDAIEQFLEAAAANRRCWILFPPMASPSRCGASKAHPNNGNCKRCLSASKLPTSPTATTAPPPAGGMRRCGAVIKMMTEIMTDKRT